MPSNTKRHIYIYILWIIKSQHQNRSPDIIIYYYKAPYIVNNVFEKLLFSDYINKEMYFNSLAFQKLQKINSLIICFMIIMFLSSIILIIIIIYRCTNSRIILVLLQKSSSHMFQNQLPCRLRMTKSKQTSP